MIVHDVIQGTSEWLALRAGIPTASNFDMIITPKGKASAQSERYLHTLLAERIMGRPVTEIVTTWMDRGNQLEAEAVSYYEGIKELDTVKVGFLTNDERTIGASPDRFVGEDGLLEIKAPKESTHVGYLLTKAVDAAYYPQVQGQLWVSGRAWLDIMSYHPDMPPALIRVNRDADYINMLAMSLRSFCRELELATSTMRRLGWIKI
jgi:hypothetical protein